jgi:hypothetical protein
MKPASQLGSLISVDSADGLGAGIPFILFFYFRIKEKKNILFFYFRIKEKKDIN